jgi:hypothetical protein
MSDLKSKPGMLIVILVTLLSGFVLGQLYFAKALGQSTNSVNPSSASSVTPQSTQKWEYLVTHSSRDKADAFQPAFTKLGEEGWEYVGIVCNNGLNAHYIAFKRRKL